MIFKGGIGLRKTTLFIGALAGMILNGAVVFAQETPNKEETARTLYNEGMNIAEGGDCKRAVDWFMRSMDVLPNKGSLYNLAICYNKLGQYQQAMGALLQLVREFDADLRDDMKASARAEMKALKEKFAWVTIKTDHVGADVLVEEQSQGKTPLDTAIPLEKEKLTIVVSLKGYAPWVKRVDFTSGGEETFDVKLVPEDGQLTLVTAMDGATVIVDEQTVGVTPLPSPIDLPPGEHSVQLTHSTIEPIEQFATVKSGELTTLVIDKWTLAAKKSEKRGDARKQKKRTFLFVFSSEAPFKQRLFSLGGIATAGVGVASIIGGIATGAMALGMDKDLSKKCPENECSEGVDYASDEKKMNNLGAASTALLTVGGVMTAAGVTLVVLSYKLDFSESEQVGFVPVLSPALVGASLRYSF